MNDSDKDWYVKHECSYEVDLPVDLENTSAIMSKNSGIKYQETKL